MYIAWYIILSKLKSIVCIWTESAIHNHVIDRKPHVKGNIEQIWIKSSGFSEVHKLSKMSSNGGWQKNWIDFRAKSHKPGVRGVLGFSWTFDPDFFNPILNQTGEFDPASSSRCLSDRGHVSPEAAPRLLPSQSWIVISRRSTNSIIVRSSKTLAHACLWDVVSPDQLKWLCFWDI